MRGKLIVSATLAVSCGPASFEASGQTGVDVVIISPGQSEATGFEAVYAGDPPGIPATGNTDLRFWRRQIASVNNDNAWSDLRVDSNGYHGLEMTLGLGLYAAGRKAAIFKCTRNGTRIGSWEPGEENGDFFTSELEAAWAALDGVFPNMPRRVHQVFFIGTTDANTAPITGAQGWAESAALIQAEAERITGATIEPIVVRNGSWLSPQLYLSTVRAEQEEFAAHVIDTDDLQSLGYVNPDGTHILSAGQNLIGDRVLAVVVP